MAYRRPTSSICLLKGVPCDHEYHHSVWYTSRQAQFDDMMTFPHEWFNHLSYQRKGRNSFKIEVPVNSFYQYLDYNYVIFSNANTDIDDYSTITKSMNLFYCFLDTIEYVNDNTVEVFYNIDYIQTFMFDYSLGQCFVEREHSYSDEMYEHLENEPFSPNDYYYDLLVDKTYSDFSIQIKYVINNKLISSWYYENNDSDDLIHFNIVNATSSYPKASIRNGTYAGCSTVTFPLRRSIIGIKDIENCLTGLEAGGTTEIVEMSLIPSSLSVHRSTPNASPAGGRLYYETPNLTESVVGYPDENSNTLDITFPVIKPTSFKGIDGSTYTPKNKKLYNYPYSSLYVTNNTGKMQVLLWENFKNNINFSEIGCVYGVPEISIVPVNYNGKQYAVENAISVQDFPSCSWNFDTALAYWQQNKGQITANIISSLLAWGLGTSVTKTLSGGIYSSSGSIGLGNISEGNSIVPYGGPIIPYGSTNNSEFISGNLVNSYTPLSPQYHVSQSLLGVHGQLSLLRQVGGLLDLTRKPDMMLGTQTYSQLPLLNGYYGFKIFHQGVKPYEAKLIDDYFSFFGYSCKKLKTPNLFTANGTNRPEWYYIKNAYTKIDNHFALSPQPIIDGYVNEETESKLKEIYNNGITFWFNSSHVGNYSLDNSPIT